MPGFVVPFKDTSFAGVCSFASHEIDRPVLLAQCNLAAHRCSLLSECIKGSARGQSFLAVEVTNGYNMMAISSPSVVI